MWIVRKISISHCGMKDSVWLLIKPKHDLCRGSEHFGNHDAGWDSADHALSHGVVKCSQRIEPWEWNSVNSENVLGNAVHGLAISSGSWTVLDETTMSLTHKPSSSSIQVCRNFLNNGCKPLKRTRTLLWYYRIKLCKVLRKLRREKYYKWKTASVCLQKAEVLWNSNQRLNPIYNQMKSGNRSNCAKNDPFSSASN